MEDYKLFLSELQIKKVHLLHTINGSTCKFTRHFENLSQKRQTEATTIFDILMENAVCTLFLQIQVSLTRAEHMTDMLPEASRKESGKEELSLSKDKQPYLSLDVNEILLMYNMREQTTKFHFQFSSVYLCHRYVPGQLILSMYINPLHYHKLGFDYERHFSSYMVVFATSEQTAPSVMIYGYCWRVF